MRPSNPERPRIGNPEVVAAKEGSAPAGRELATVVLQSDDPDGEHDSHVRPTFLVRKPVDERSAQGDAQRVVRSRRRTEAERSVPKTHFGTADVLANETSTNDNGVADRATQQELVRGAPTLVVGGEGAA